jgi:hypothetical protein
MGAGQAGNPLSEILDLLDALMPRGASASLRKAKQPLC